MDHAKARSFPASIWANDLFRTIFEFDMHLKEQARFIPVVVGKLAETFKIYPNIGTLLPAMWYGEQQIKDLEKTIENTPCDVVVIATPIDLSRIIKINKPSVKVGYDLQEIGKPDLTDVVIDFLKQKNMVTKGCSCCG